ncbi:MAG: SPFH domain-containing protein [bacterium]|nr:SPFH domain-containing protein [bacterium]
MSERWDKSAENTPRSSGSSGCIKFVFIFAVVFFLLLVFLNMFFVYVKPYEYGVKEIRLGGHRGIQDKVYTAGYHFLIPGIQFMHRFPRNTQLFDLTNYPSKSTHRYEKAAHIQTSDGFFVDVDVSILFRIEDPVMVIRTIGPGTLYFDNGIIPKAEPSLKATLGELTTEEFYNSPLRVAKVNESKNLLNNELKEKGIIVEHILIRYFVYSPEIQKNIEEKKLKDQLVFTNQSKAKAAAEWAKLLKVIEEGEANVKVKLEEGKAYVMTRNAEKDLYVRKKKAEADLLIKLAEAQKTDMINDAYRVPGVERLVGLRMAEILDGIELIIIPSDGKDGLNPLDIDKDLKLFEVRNK